MAIILIIGEYSGVGLELSNQLANQGHNVIATYNRNTVKSSYSNLSYHKLIQNLINTADKLTLNDQRHPLKRIGKPEYIANMTEFSLSSKASWITGQISHVD